MRKSTTKKLQNHPASEWAGEREREETTQSVVMGWITLGDTDTIDVCVCTKKQTDTDTQEVCLICLLDR